MRNIMRNFLKTFVILFTAAIILTSCGGGGGGSGAAPVATTSNETAKSFIGNISVSGTSYQALNLKDNGTFELIGNSVTTTGTYSASSRAINAGTYMLYLDNGYFYIDITSAQSVTFVNGTVTATGTANYSIDILNFHCPICGKRICNLDNNNTEVVAGPLIDNRVLIEFACNDCHYSLIVPLTRNQIIVNGPQEYIQEADDLFIEEHINPNTYTSINHD